jgi:hypothetical protein
MASLKQQIVEVLDKSTNNGMKANEIMGFIEMGIIQAQYDMLEEQKNNRDTPSTTANDRTLKNCSSLMAGTSPQLTTVTTDELFDIAEAKAFCAGMNMTNINDDEGNFPDAQ